MAIDPRQLRPSELARLLNSTPLGTVIEERQLYRHRTRAGFRIGDGRRVDLFRYIGWLIEERRRPRPDKARDYEAIKEAAAARNRALSEAGRDIGEYFLRPTYHVVTEHWGHRDGSNSQKHFLVVVTAGVLICESTKLALEPD